MPTLSKLAEGLTNQPDIPIVYIASIYKKLTDLGSFNITAHGPSHSEDDPKESRVVQVTGKGLKKASSSTQQGQWLARLANHTAEQTQGPIAIVEIGTCVGISGMYLLAALERNNGGSLTTFEGSPELAAIAEANMNALISDNGFTKVSFSIVVGGLDSTFKKWMDQSNQNIDLAFIDGNHRELPTLDYHHTIRQRISDIGIIVHDDVSWGDGMVRAWKKIKSMESESDIGELYLGGIPSRGVVFIGESPSKSIDVVHLDSKIERTLRTAKRIALKILNRKG